MRKKPVEITSAVILLLGLLLMLMVSLYGWGLGQSIVAFGEIFSGALKQITLLPEGDAESESATFLIYGLDVGEWVGETFRPGVGRADTIVLIQARPADNRAALLSIPRDTLVEIPGRAGDDKINHAYTFGQSELLVKTVERFTGVPVDFYLGLNYRAFSEIVDLLGGVEFNVDREIRSGGLHLQPGTQLLNGAAAFALITDRQETMGDIGRVQRQQRFIKALFTEMKTRPADELLYTALVAWKNMDTNLNLVDLLRLYRDLRGIREEDILMAIVPGWFFNRDGISYWRPFPAETKSLIAQLFGQTEAEGSSCDS